MTEGEQGREPRQVEGLAFASLLGRFQLRASDGSELILTNRRVRAVLAMLCVEPSKPIERDYLSKLLWPGRFEAHAKASLRQCLLELGKALGPIGGDLVEVTRSLVSLCPSAIRTDLGELERALRLGHYAVAADQLAAIGAAPMLEQMEFGDAFADWLSRHRAQTEQRLQAAISAGLAALERTGNQEMHARLLNSALLRKPLTQGSDAANSASSKTPIAVLPFQPMGMGEKENYFADGVVDELITSLGQVPQLRVAGRTSSFHFRGSDMSLPAIADALGVSHLIEGSVQRQEEQVRIFVRLIDGATGFELWGQRFDGTLDDIFGLQEKVARAATAALAEKLNLAMDAPFVRTMTASKEAYDLYLQGRALGSRIFGEGVLNNAIRFLEQALAIDPLFAEAWIELAEAHHNIATYTQCHDRNAAALRMAECARKAIALAPQLGYPYALLATYEWTRNNVVGALDQVFEAYRREPSHPGVAMRVGSFLIYCGRTADAIPYVRAAIDQDPVDPRKYALAWSIHFARDELDAALEAALRIVDLGWPSMQLAMTSVAMGNHELAVEQYLLTKRLVNTIILPPVGSGTMSDEAMNAYWLVAAKGICSGQESDRQIYAQVLAMMYATLPDKADLAITGPAMMTGNAGLVFNAFGYHITPANVIAFMWLWADIDPIRQIWQHPEFIPFAQRIGMAAAWDKYGWPDLLPPPDNR